MSNHVYTGAGGFCLKCFKKLDDPVHVMIVQRSCAESAALDQTNAPTPKLHVWTSPHIKGKFVLEPCFDCGKMPSDPVHIQTGVILPEPQDGLHITCPRCGRELPPGVRDSNCLDCATLLAPLQEWEQKCNALFPTANAAREELAPKCPGHACQSCNKVWKHGYACGKPSKIEALCTSCAQQATDINRPSLIEEIAKSQRLLTGQECSELTLRYETFVVKNLIHNPVTGKENADWQDQVSAFILAQKRIIEELRIKISSAHRVRADQMCKDMTKLTPEEREQYSRLAAKGKKPGEKTKKVIKSIEDTKEAKANLYQDTLKLIMSTLRGNSDAAKIAKERLASMGIANPEDSKA